MATIVESGGHREVMCSSCWQLSSHRKQMNCPVQARSGYLSHCGDRCSTFLRFKFKEFKSDARANQIRIAKSQRFDGACEKLFCKQQTHQQQAGASTIHSSKDNNAEHLDNSHHIHLPLLLRAAAAARALNIHRRWHRVSKFILYISKQYNNKTNSSNTNLNIVKLQRLLNQY